MKCQGLLSLKDKYFKVSSRVAVISALRVASTDNHNIQSNFNGSNIFGTMETCLRHW